MIYFIYHYVLPLDAAELFWYSLLLGINLELMFETFGEEHKPCVNLA